MPSADRTPSEHAEFQIRWNQRSFKGNLLLMIAFFLAYLALVVFASGFWRFIGVAGVVVFGGFGLYAGVWAPGSSAAARWPQP